MIRLALAIVCLLPSASSAAEQWGLLRGRFVYDGEHPAPQKLNVAPGLLLVCGRQNLYDESLQVGRRGGIANVVVWVHTRGMLIHPRYEKEANKRVVYDNRGCRFSPHVLPLWTPQTLELHNADPVAHNVNMAPLGGAATNPLLEPAGSVDYKFTRSSPVPVPVTCNLHPWMKGWIVVRDNPYTAVTGDDGRFEVHDLPLGEWEFRAWHERSGYIRYAGWNKGKFKHAIKAGDNDLGNMKLAIDQFQ